MRIIADGYACRDCILMMANGDEVLVYTDRGPLDEAATEARTAAVATATAGWCCCSSEDDPVHPDHEFSWSPCCCCRSRLGGWRGWAVKLA